jgi:RHS repeat-associated protein
MIFDKTGSLANTKRHDYLPFGEELFANQGLRTGTMGYSASDSVRQKFSQKERDNETGLDYFGARYYGSMMGRFTGADSLLGSLTNPQTLNRYAYVGNDPLNFTDPTGHARFDVPSKFENGGELRLNPYEDAIAWQNVEYTVAAADAAAANASEPEPEAAAYAGDGIVSAGETDADETNQQPQNTATEPFVVSNPAALESGIVAGQIAYRDSNDVAQCARLPLEWQINQENFEISRANRGRRLTANWVMGPEITYGMDLAYGTVLATFIRETGIYGNGEPHTGSHTVVFFRWETRNGELGMVVGQQMAGRHGSAERGFIPFKADNPYYANAYRFNVVLIPRALRRFTMADKE